MPECAVKRGFFVLRDCRQPTSSLCSSCSRPVCPEHSTIETGSLLCLECAARREKPTDEEQRKREQNTNWWQNRQSSYFYRDRYYSSSSYHPFYYGTYYDSYYDSYDMRSFDRKSGEAEEQEDKAEAGLSDS